MKAFKQFTLWRLEPNLDGGKPRKMPYRVDGSSGSSTDPAAWCTADEALAAAERCGMGVGFVLTDADPYAFIDIDNCVSANAWDADFMDAYNRFPGAAFEVSQSGTGAHMFMRGVLPVGYTGRKRGKFECYRTGRFVALTGISAQGSVDTDVGGALAKFVADKFPQRVDSEVGQLEWRDGPIAEWNGPTDDAELLKQFLAAPLRATAAEAFKNLGGSSVIETNSASNADLFNANAAVLGVVYPSDKGDPFDMSAAAYALALRLAYWTGKDCSRMERLMNRAAFRRTRADQRHDNDWTYMQWDIVRACAHTTSVRYERAAVANAAVVEGAADAFNEYESRLCAAGSPQDVRAVCEEIANDLRIDRFNRQLLTTTAHNRFDILDSKVKRSDVERLTQQRAAHPAPDRQALQRATNTALNLPEETVLLAPVMQTAQMLEEFVFIADGSQVASIVDRHLSFSMADFTNTFAASRTVIDQTTVRHSEEWLKHAGRKFVLTRTFKAGAPVITHDPGGRSALNNWRPIVRSGVVSVDVSPFVEHIQYLFGADADAFLDWLAHIEQFPGVLPHHGWLHIADSFGTGRNWLESVICRLWRGYVAPSVDMDSLISGGFNGSLAGRVIAIVDEIRAGGREDAYMMEGKIRNMLTEETRYVKPKYGREYAEHNACRWLLFSNHKDAIPMDDNDRRWYVVHLAAAPRADHVYAYLYSLLENPAFIDSLGVWLRMRDISKFNPGARPPVTEAKRRAIEASKSDFQRLARLIVKHWPSDFIDAASLTSIMFEDDMSAAGKRLNRAMKDALTDAGMERCDKHVYDAQRNKFSVWFVRNVEKYRADTSVIVATPQLIAMKSALKGTGYQSLMGML